MSKLFHGQFGERVLEFWQPKDTFSRLPIFFSIFFHYKGKSDLLAFFAFFWHFLSFFRVFWKKLSFVSFLFFGVGLGTGYPQNLFREITPKTLKSAHKKVFWGSFLVTTILSLFGFWWAYFPRERSPKKFLDLEFG